MRKLFDEDKDEDDVEEGIGLDEFAAIAILPRKRNFSVPLELLAPA